MKKENGVRKYRLVYILCFLVFLFIDLKNSSPAATMLLLFMAVYAIAAFLSVRICGRRMDIDCGSGGMIEKGETMEAEISFRNRGKLPVFCCTCEVAAINLLTGEAKTIPVSFPLGSGGIFRQSLALTDQYCGKIRIRLEKLQIRDPLQIFQSGRSSSSESAGYFAPQVSPELIPEEYLDSYNMESYQYSQYEKGADPGEVFGVRDYQEGDSLKQIHWKLSAKLDELTVKIPSYPIENNILLILDNLLDPQTKADPKDRSLLVERFYSLSDALLEKGIPHSIGWYDVQKQCFCIRRIGTQEQLQQTIPEVLGCGFEESEVSTIYRYLESREGRNFTNHFLVTAQQGRDAGRLESYGAVYIFRKTE